jgi:hypothetical protein
MLYRDITRYKYQLAEPMVFMTGITGYSFAAEFIEMSPKGQLTILTDYLWDGPSGPTMDTLDSMRGSLLHDALYECIRRELLPLTIKDKADRLLHDICTEDGMDKHRADLWYDMVSKFAWSSCIPGTEVKDNVLDTEVKE